MFTLLLFVVSPGYYCYRDRKNIVCFWWWYLPQSCIPCLFWSEWCSWVQSPLYAPLQQHRPVINFHEPILQEKNNTAIMSKCILTSQTLIYCVSTESLFKYFGFNNYLCYYSIYYGQILSTPYCMYLGNLIPNSMQKNVRQLHWLWKLPTLKKKKSQHIKGPCKWVRTVKMTNI